MLCRRMNPENIKGVSIQSDENVQKLFQNGVSSTPYCMVKLSEILR